LKRLPNAVCAPTVSSRRQLNSFRDTY